ncbi:hypothetical protein LA76x_2166 [Lysobacter antibioticus]|uniref:Uncharacterized protein n=1 Tax=Lysobacter antibioticus TaxID=84531 RepID=A0A0S2F9V6_LYSAN|nr:hypothetical protein LA76x_2166 [Lysobacter antibioticus]
MAFDLGLILLERNAARTKWRGRGSRRSYSGSNPERRVVEA